MVRPRINPLNRKLLRDLWHIRSQALAIAMVVACGIAMFVMSYGMMAAMETTRDAYYDRYRFADVFAAAKRAPEHVMTKIRAIDGVSAAQSRISVGVLLDVEGVAEPITGRMQSLPDSGRPVLNDLVLRTGRWVDPRRADEVVVNERFAEAHALVSGDTLSAIINGRKQKLTVVGTALSPEYIYAIGPGQLIPDDRRFGVLWVARRQLEAAFDLDGAFNEATLRLRRGARVEEVIDRVDALLAPYGGVGAYAREDHISDEFVSSELDQLATMTAVMPPIFLGVAAFLLNIVVSRLIDTEREQIGLLKSFGYSDAAVGWHYLKFVLAMTAIGLVAGCGVGVWLGRGLAELYQEYYRFPFLYFRAGPAPYVYATLAAGTAALLGTVMAVRRAITLPPAEAMRPPAPADYSKRLLGRFDRARFLDEPSRMVIRHIARNPMRGVLTVLGIAMAMGLYIGSAASTDAIEKMVWLTFDQVERQDMTVLLVEPRHDRILHEFTRMPGVRAVEPFRSVAAKLRFGPREERQGLTGMLPHAEMGRLIDRDERAIQVPEAGLMLSAPLGERLGVGAGDVLTVEVMEGRQPTFQVRVAGLVEAYIGTPAYLHIGELNRLMKEGPTVSGARLLVDDARAEPLYTLLKDTPVVAGVELNAAAARTFRTMMDENMGRMILFNVVFAGLIVFGVVYNNARIALAERGRELASLRVLGFRRSEVSYILLAEMALLTLISLPLGVAFGIGLARYLAATWTTDLFVIPYALQTDTIAQGALVVVASAIVSALLVRRRIDTLDLIEVLKTRE